MWGRGLKTVGPALESQWDEIGGYCVMGRNNKMRCSSLGREIL